MSDPYLQPNGTLKNNLGVTDPQVLSQLEADFTDYRLATVEEDGPQGPFTYARFKATHHYLFQDIYSWAGEPRITELYKAAQIGGPLHQFTPVAELEDEAERIFTSLSEVDEYRGLDRPTFSVRAANLLSDINQLHPFREGNGRTQRVFVEALAKAEGHTLTFDVVSRERMILASIEASQGQRDMMRRLVNEISDPERVAPMREAISFLESESFNWNERYLATTEPGRLYEGTFVGQGGEHFMMHVGEKLLVGKVSDLNTVPESGAAVRFRSSS